MTPIQPQAINLSPEFLPQIEIKNYSNSSYVNILISILDRYMFTANTLDTKIKIRKELQIFFPSHFTRQFENDIFSILNHSSVYVPIKNHSTASAINLILEKFKRYPGTKYDELLVNQMFEYYTGATMKGLTGRHVVNNEWTNLSVYPIEVDWNLVYE